jgi:hypothetical protein
MEKTMKKYNLNINVKQTKIMICGEKQADKITIKLGHHKIAVMEEFCYLGGRITSDGRRKKDIVSRMAQVKKAIYCSGPVYDMGVAR